MRSLATQLSSAVLSVLIDNGGVAALSDDDYAFLNLVCTWAQARESGTSLSELADKAATDIRARRQPQADAQPQTLPTDAASTGPVMPPAAPLTPTFPGMPAPAAPSTAEQQEALPLGTMDRGPDPQDLGTLLSTDAPLDGAQVDPTDPPYDYSRLPVQKTTPQI